jgi:hypothetical protein
MTLRNPWPVGFLALMTLGSCLVSAEPYYGPGPGPGGGATGIAVVPESADGGTIVVGSGDEIAIEMQSSSDGVLHWVDAGSSLAFLGDAACVDSPPPCQALMFSADVPFGTYQIVLAPELASPAPPSDAPPFDQFVVFVQVR